MREAIELHPRAKMYKDKLNLSINDEHLKLNGIRHMNGGTQSIAFTDLAYTQLFDTFKGEDVDIDLCCKALGQVSKETVTDRYIKYTKKELLTTEGDLKGLPEFETKSDRESFESVYENLDFTNLPDILMEIEIMERDLINLKDIAIRTLKKDLNYE